MSVENPRIAICPGSYDPVTNGHLDIIGRASRIFDRGDRRGRQPGDPQEQDAVHGRGAQRGFLERATADLDNIEIKVFSTLLVDFARENGATTIVKGLRAISDFEYEFEMNQLNRKLAPEIESACVMASPSSTSYPAPCEGASHLRRRRHRSRPGGGGDGSRGADRALSAWSRGFEKSGQELASGRRNVRRRGNSRLTPKIAPQLWTFSFSSTRRPDPQRARPVPLTDQVRVDREEIYDLLDQMRATIPENQAGTLDRQGRQEMLAEAKREAERVVKEARDQQARLIAEEEVYKQAGSAAPRRSSRTPATPSGRSASARRTTPTRSSPPLESNLQKFLAAVQRGRDRLCRPRRGPSKPSRGRSSGPRSTSPSVDVSPRSREEVHSRLTPPL